MTSAPPGEAAFLLRFGVFLLDPRTGELRKSGLPLKLQQRPARVLALLASHPGQLLTREEIQKQVWTDGTFVDFELGLNTCIRQIRIAVGDDAETPRFIETLPRRGYRFIAPVERVQPDPEHPVETPQRMRRRILPTALAAALACIGLAPLLSRAVHSRSAQNPGPGIVYQRLTFRRGAVSSARFAPGGRVVYSASWDGAPPELYESDGVTGDARHVDVEGDKVVSVSSRGELSYLSANTLTRTPLLGGLPKPILKNVWVAAETRDGSEAAIVRRGADDRMRIEFPVGHVLCEAASPTHLRVSPDGRSIAFLEHPVPGDDRGAVVVAERDGRRRVLSSGWSSIEGLAWRPDGGEIWFTATRVGADNALHAVDLDGHERAVAPGVGRLVLQDIGLDGKVLLVRGDVRTEIRYVDAHTGAERDLSWQDFSTLRDFSADGRTVLFEESGQGGGEGYSVFVRGIDRTPAIRIGHGISRALSPDGRWALTVPIAQPDRIEVIPVGQGEARVVQNPGIERYDTAQWLPDGTGFVFSGADREGVSRVYLQSLAGGTSLHPITPGGAIAPSHMLSPDGQRLIATCGEHYCLYAVNGGAPPQQLAGVDPSYRPLCWGDPGHIYFAENAGAFNKVYSLDLSAGRLSPWKTLVPSDAAGFEGLVNFLTTVDGRAYAYSYRRVISELYVVSNLS